MGMDFMLAVAGTLSRVCRCSFELVGGIYKKENGESFSTFSVVPRPGIEPGWVAPLVFETSASTDSAIWAFVFLKCDAKVYLFLLTTKCFGDFLKKVFNLLPMSLKSSTFAGRLLST